MKKRTLLSILGAVYALGMLWLLFHRAPHAAADGYWRSLPAYVNPVPFRTVFRLARAVLRAPGAPRAASYLANLLGNVLLFVPAGFFLPALWKKERRYGVFLLTAAGMILLLETAQLFTLLGFFDVDDLILNLLGMSAGFLLFRLFAGKKKSG